jgi:hypothetical protein
MMKRICVIFLMVALLVTSAQAVKTHYWDFEGGVGDTSDTGAVGGAPGTLHGEAWVAGGKLLTQNTNSWMDMDGSVINLASYDEITIEAWYTPKPGANPGWSMLMSFGQMVEGWKGINYIFLTSHRADDVSRAAISTGTSDSPWADEDGANGPEYDSGLHHLVGTFSALTNEVRLYMDGALQQTVPLSAHNLLSEISPEQANLAKAVYGDPLWNGYIHEAAIYNTALGEQEVAANFEAGIPEPTTIALLGLGTLALLRKRK